MSTNSFTTESPSKKTDSNDVEKEAAKSLQQSFLTPKEVREHLGQVWAQDGDFLNILLGGYQSPKSRHRKSTSEMFFIDILPVIPTRFRPVSFALKILVEN